MRYSLILVILFFAFNGCKENSDTIISVPDVGGLQYTFSTLKPELGTHDTLSAEVTVFNPASVPQTVTFTGFSFSWSLENESGRAIMFGPRHLALYIGKRQLGSHQSVKLYGFSEAIADTSGQPVLAGPYVLKASVDTLHFSLDLKLD